MTREQLERALVGRLLGDPEPGLLDEIRVWVKPDYFGDQLLRRAYDAIFVVAEDGVEPNILNIRAKGGFSDSESTVLAACESEGIGGNWKSLSLALLEAVILDKIRTAGREAATSRDPFQGVLALERAVTEVSDMLLPVRRKEKGQQLEEYSAYLLENARGGVKRIPTTLPTLTQMLNGGFAPGDLTLLGGFPGAGKTSLALAFAMTAASAGFQTSIIEAEMSTIELLERLNAIASGNPVAEVRKGNRYPELSEKFIGDLHALPLTILQVAEREPDSLVRLISGQASKGATLIIVDYLQVFAGEGRQAADEFYKIKRISERLRGLALRHGVHLLVISSLNRNETGRQKPSMHSFYGSSGLAHDCHVGLILSGSQRDAAEMESGNRIVTLSVVKNRSGFRGEINLRYDLRSQRMVELSDRE